MTAHSQKTKQKRLRSCVLSQLRWAKIRKKAQHHDQVAIKINDLVAKTAARVENTLEFSQKQHNTTLLGKYPIKILSFVQRHIEQYTLEVLNLVISFFTNPISISASIRRA